MNKQKCAANVNCKCKIVLYKIVNQTSKTELGGHIGAYHRL